MNKKLRKANCNRGKLTIFQYYNISLENFTVEPYAFYVRWNKNGSKNVACNTKKNKKSFCCFSCFAQHFCCKKQIFLSVSPWSHSIQRFREAQLLLANHKTCLQCSILKRIFDFENVYKQFYFKNNMAQGKITDEEKGFAVEGH